MTMDNTAQIAEWNGVQGERWAKLREQTGGVTAAFGAAAMKAAAPAFGERVLDVGCGCGDTSIELARRVGAAGRVLGVDVSQPMLEVARERLARAALPQLEFRECDASQAGLPAGTELIYSRFGVMFFADPPGAFAHLRASMRAGGRCAFVCWRAPRDNPWTMIPVNAARAAMGVTPPPADPHAPGPFAFADEARVRGILAAAGFVAIAFERFDSPVSLGATPRGAAQATTQIGPVSRFVREVGEEHRDTIAAAVERALEPHAASDGRVLLQGSTWIVTARNP